MEIGRSKLSQIKVRVYVTEDLVIDILSRLPAKVLLRFRCVSKQWDALPKSSYFAAIHHRRSNPNDCILLKYKDSQSPAYCTGIPLYSIGLLGSKASFDISFLELRSRITYVEIVGSSRGLVCLRLSRYNPEDPRKIIVWNPATKQVRSPPEPKLLGNIPSSYEYSHFELGFGFINDDVTDYILVALVVRKHREKQNRRVHQAQVFTRSTNCWREVKNFPSCVHACIGYAITLNGAMYWLASHPTPQFVPRSVLCFDLRDEVFHTIELPRRRGIDRLLAWKNSLAFIATDHIRQLDIWVMTDEEYEVGKQVSWAKQFSILLSPERLGLIGVWKNQCVFKARGSIESMVFCDPTTSRKMKRLPELPEHDKGFEPTTAASYVESLFPV